MIKILIQIKDNKLFFSIRRRLNYEQKSLINTNVISQNELVFSDEYIVSNLKLVHTFVYELVNSYSINTIIIKELDIAPLVLHVIEGISEIKSLYLLEETSINYHTCKSILKCKSIKYISLYSIPDYLLEMLDDKNVVVDSRNEMFFISNFMKNNNLDKFSSLYYKTSINISFPLSKEDEQDFISFININRYLKYIYLDNINKADIEYILKHLYKRRLKNIIIYIKDNINNPELIEYLKRINKKNAKVNGIQFKIDYSEKYLEDNLVGQLQLNTIKSCIMISLLLVSSVIIYIFSSNYVSMQKVDEIKEEINTVIAKAKEEKEENPVDIEQKEDEQEFIIKPDQDEQEFIIKPDQDEQEVKEEPKKEINEDIKSLKEMNEDTVGWLKVNDTNIDYPVVQAKDNDYYINRNFKKKKDASGWVFLDYRADAENLSPNNVIFGHNMYYSGVMFGTLYKAKRSSWYKNKDNQIIEYNTLYDNMKWQIFSIYVVDNTNDYLVVDFDTKESFQEFINMITNRSINDFNVPVSTDDKILTLSTCSNNGTKRLVIHAVLLKES